MGKSSKKSKRHQRKRSSSESSDSSEGSPKRAAQREPEERHRRKREASDDGRGVSSKWDSPEENSLSYRRHRERNFEPHREDHNSGRRDNRQQRDRHLPEDRRDRSGRRQRPSPSPKVDPRDSRRRNEERHLEDQPRRHRDEGQERGRRHRESREERNEPNERFHDRERRYDDGKRRRDHRSRSRNRKFPRHDEEDRNYEWGKHDDKSFEQKEPAEKEKPNFGLSGKLTEDTNKVNGVVIKYAEPQEARKPKRRWRLYPFKGEQALPTMYIHRQSCFLIGRDAKVCDLRVDHPSCSKQHAALQYRLVPFEREDGSVGKRVRPYIIDLESSNGTFVNNNRVDARKYVELLEKDVIKFGFSSREYVLLHENSHEETLDDDVNLDQEIKTEPAE